MQFLGQPLGATMKKAERYLSFKRNKLNMSLQFLAPYIFQDGGNKMSIFPEFKFCILTVTAELPLWKGCQLVKFAQMCIGLFDGDYMYLFVN